MDQPTFADLEYQGKKRKTRRELFLERMDGLIPWQRLEEHIRPCYPKAGNCSDLVGELVQRGSGMAGARGCGYVI